MPSEPKYRFQDATNWDAFIAGKPNAKSRNEKLWIQAGKMLGINALITDR